MPFGSENRPAKESWPGEIGSTIRTVFRFREAVRDEDSIRVRSFENALEKIDESKVDVVCGKWLKVSVQLDGIHPPIQRDLLVSPEISIKCLHDQVICPTMNWKPN